MNRMEVDLSSSEVDEFSRIGKSLLDLSREIHDDLGPRGAELTGDLNQYGEPQLVVDRDIEKGLRDFLKDSPDSGRNWEIRSEEFLTEFVHPNREVEGVIVIDGTDGSNAAQMFLLGSQSELAKRYATMVAAGPGDDPLYKDFIFGGVNEHALKRKLTATAGLGAFMETADGISIPVHATELPTEELGPETPIYSFDRLLFKRFNTDQRVFRKLDQLEVPRSRLLSSASHWVDLATDAMIDVELSNGEIVKRRLAAVVETSRKGQEEWPAASRIAEESGITIGTTVTTTDGKKELVELRDLRFKTWRQRRPGSRPLTGLTLVGSPSKSIVNRLIMA